MDRRTHPEKIEEALAPPADRHPNVDLLLMQINLRLPRLLILSAKTTKR